MEVGELIDGCVDYRVEMFIVLDGLRRLGLLATKVLP